MDAMIAFRIDVNGKRMCVAGVGEYGVLSTIVDYVGNRQDSTLHVSVGGLYSATKEHAIWKRVALKIGDRVAVTVIETDSPDKPRTRYRRSSKTEERNQKAYVKAMAKKFGWKILKRGKESK